MSANLTRRANGKVEMAYVGEMPWHREGQLLRAGAPIEEWATAAGMDWQVKRSRVRYGEGAAARTWDDMHVLFRSDSKAPLGVVSDKYEIVHPGQVLEFFRDMTADMGFQLETAGTLFGGRRFWAMAKISEAKLAGWDRIGGYCLLNSSCDGSAATDAFGTTQRVVCSNTLAMAMAGARTNAVRVTHRSVFDAEAVKKKMGLGREQFAAFTEVADRLTRVKVSMAAADTFIQTLLRAPADVRRPDAKPHVGEATILALFGGKGKGSTQPGSAGTAWGLLNAVTEYVDHVAVRKSDDHRLFQSLFGAGDSLKTEALNLAISL